MNNNNYGNNSGDQWYNNNWDDYNYGEDDYNYGGDDYNYGGDYSGRKNYGYHQGGSGWHRNFQAGYGPNFYGPGPVPPDLPGPWGCGFGPKGPPFYLKDDTPSQILLSCGVPKRIVCGLPKTFLDLIGYEGCGLCHEAFTSLDMCRSHYNSTKHLKLQKKWFAHRAELGVSRSKQAPLKSRDYFCELCDIEITSKMHADSHYGGKAHRAVVLGRKHPRNPYLLQPCMKDRLDLIIRREKRCLNLFEEPEENMNKAKPLQAELFCDICKTHVTCSEQMTVHLNGKRHLSKEKAHIFSMIKAGEVNEDAVSKKETAVKDKTARTESQENKDDEDKDHDIANDDPH